MDLSQYPTMSKVSFRARTLDASKPLPIYKSEDLPDLYNYNVINRAVPQMPTGMEKEEESVSPLFYFLCFGLVWSVQQYFGHVS